MDIKIIPATLDQQPILANLLELYTYDFTDITPFDIGDNGFYGYEWLPTYWSDPERYPFLIYVDNKIAGFVLVKKGSFLEDSKEMYDIAEFFIMRKYRRNKIGTMVAIQIWQMFKGAWQVRVLIDNVRAMAFWLQAIDNFTQGQFASFEKNMKEDNWIIYRFESL